MHRDTEGVIADAGFDLQTRHHRAVPRTSGSLILRGGTTVVDIAAEPQVSVWDLALLDILVREAGGTLTGLEGTAGAHRDSAVATNGLLSQLVRTRLKGG